jgi:hypothetical protein
MGKKGKKAKVTGTQDVVRFKTTPPGMQTFKALEGLVAIYTELPEVSRDMLSAADLRKLGKFFTMLGALAEFTKCEHLESGGKNYRFQLHHPYLTPPPQYNPCGYRIDLISRSRKVLDTPALKLNGKAYQWSTFKKLCPDLITECDTFLGAVDKMSLSIPEFIKENLPDFAPGGLKKFKNDLYDRMFKFDAMWRAHEQLMMQVWLEIHNDVFKPISVMVQIEAEMSKAEELEDMQEKQKLEEELVKAAEEFYNVVYPPKQLGANKWEERAAWPDEVIPLAEACVFYESKMDQERLNLCRYVLKAFMELRKAISDVPIDRIHEEYTKNEDLVRVLGCFQRAIMDALEPLEHTAGLPRIGNFKREQWMTRAVLEPEVDDINRNAFKIADVVLPPKKDDDDDF